VLKTLARLRVPLGFVFGAAVLHLAQPTRRSILVGTGVALAGEAFRIWAAGHLEKSREVTQSGPYRLTRHPLYAGSFVMGIGAAIAAGSWIVAALVGLYLAATLTAAIRTEEAFLRARFGDEYEAYARARGPVVRRRFSFERAWRNREYRAVAGLIAAIGLLSIKALLG